MDAGDWSRQREQLSNVIAQWNADRLDLFELSEPNENLEFHGVMRFYYQDSGEKVCTKCIRVSSTATAADVIAALVEKFRPDMRMLSTPRFAIYEIHESGEERQLAEHEMPLHVQLNWNKDDREGRFLLRNLDEKPWSLGPARRSTAGEENFKRKLSRRERKQQKKQDKLGRMQSTNENDPSVAEKLYTELPETSFTRSISNPEAVMRRRRRQKLEKKLQQFRSRDGGPDTGGTLKIYGESLCSEVPYKTLLLSVTDTAAAVVSEMLEKYGKYTEDPANYVLVQVVTQEPQAETAEYHSPTGPFKEYVLDDSECPLAILMNHPPTRGSIMFHVRRRSAEYQPRKRKKKPGPAAPVSDVDHSYRGHDEASLPFLVELNGDGTDIRHVQPRRFSLHLNVTEVGSERSSQAGGQCLQLTGHNVHPRHCVIAHTEGIVTVTPCGRQAETYVNGQRVYETSILQHGSVVQFGRVFKFRFLDPNQEERLRGTRRDSLRGSEAVMERSTTYATYGLGSEPILPAVLEFREDTEDAFLRAVITQLDPSCLQFKLAPTYTLYMSARFRASTHYRSELTPDERATKLTEVLAKVSAMIQQVIETRRHDANALAFWMANASDYLHFLKQDRHISPYSRLAQDILAESVQAAFRYLVESVQSELVSSISLFLEDRDDANEEEGTTAQVLSILGNTMALLRRCRVNAALTIQLFSQLFHYINMSVFNRVVGPGPVNYCSRLWGVRLKRRLSRIELWADRQGLELAADCHLGRIVQAAHLLTAAKSSVDELSAVASACYRLNSLQLRALLSRYRPARDEPAMASELVDGIVMMAEATSDELARQDGRTVRLEEDRDLLLPFLLPEDGYSCDIVRGIPNGLAEFIAPLQHAGLARMSEQPTSWGYWTIYMTDQELSRTQPVPQPRTQSSLSMRSLAGVAPIAESQLEMIRLHKTSTGMGLSIVAAKGAGMERPGIYIKSVVRGGAADLDGRLAAGDQLCEVDGHSLIGVTQEQAAEYMTKTGPVVNLHVCKQAAAYHGLTALLSQPSPVMSRGRSPSPNGRRLDQGSDRFVGVPASPPIQYCGGHRSPDRRASHPSSRGPRMSRRTSAAPHVVLTSDDAETGDAGSSVTGERTVMLVNPAAAGGRGRLYTTERFPGQTPTPHQRNKFRPNFNAGSVTRGTDSAVGRVPHIQEACTDGAFRDRYSNNSADGCCANSATLVQEAAPPEHPVPRSRTHAGHHQFTSTGELHQRPYPNDHRQYVASAAPTCNSASQLAYSAASAPELSAPYERPSAYKSTSSKCAGPGTDDWCARSTTGASFPDVRTEHSPGSTTGASVPDVRSERRWVSSPGSTTGASVPDVRTEHSPGSTTGTSVPDVRTERRWVNSPGSSAGPDSSSVSSGETRRAGRRRSITVQRARLVRSCPDLSESDASPQPVRPRRHRPLRGILKQSRRNSAGRENTRDQLTSQARIQPSKSVPALNAELGAGDVTAGSAARTAELRRHGTMPPSPAGGAPPTPPRPSRSRSEQSLLPGSQYRSGTPGTAGTRPAVQYRAAAHQYPPDTPVTGQYRPPGTPTGTAQSPSQTGAPTVPGSAAAQYQYQPPLAPSKVASGPAMVRSVSDHDQLRYIPTTNSSVNNLLVRNVAADNVRINGDAVGRQQDVAGRQQEILRRQQELAAAQEAERRILLEAQRRQQLQESAGARLDAVIQPPVSPPAASAAQTPPPPPVRSVSYSVMAAAANGQSPAAAAPPAHRRVQFSDEAAPEADHTAEQSLNVAATPGVIGAQEVYRDPRQRRLAQQGADSRSADSPLPERLSFQEKMRMFAAEAGAAGGAAAVARERSTASSRQREIELAGGAL